MFSALCSLRRVSKQLKPKSANIASFSAIKLKTSFVDTYNQYTPKEYVDSLNLLDYGQFQDKFVQFTQEYKNKLQNSNNNKLMVCDLGGLYGNTSLALTNNMTWNKTCQFWNDGNLNELEMNDRNKFYVIGVDISEKALEFCLKNCIYDEIYLQDLNDEFNKSLLDKLYECDILSCIMTCTYLTDGRFKQIVNYFIKNRNKNKVLFYNYTPAFDERDYSPQLLFNDVKNWESKSTFIKHRNFTEEESKRFDNNIESWAHLYAIYFPSQ